jgi:hypothetical protein
VSRVPCLLVWKTALVVASVALAAPFLSCASTPGSGGSGQNAIVNFSFDALNPKTVRIPADGNITWVNIAPDSRGFVVFPASIAQSFTCGENLQPYFRKIAGGFQSLPIGGVESNHVQLPCSLAPGSYDYEIAIMGAGLGETFESSPERKLPGTIVVE